MNGSGRNRWLWPIALVLILLVVVYAMWRKRPQEEAIAVEREVALLSRTECPFHTDPVRLITEGGSATFDTLPLVGPITGIPEYHDCQRFIDNSGRAYGPLVAIYATSYLQSVRLDPTPLQGPFSLRDTTANLEQLYVTQGPVQVDPTRTAVPADTGLVTLVPAGAALGIIVDFDLVGYQSLGIMPGANCLFVYPKRTSSGLGARVVPVGIDVVRCADPATREAPGLELRVVTQRMPLDHPNDYPGVARWDWDPRTSTQIIGIRCGSRWCQIGVQNFTTSLNNFPLSDPRERRVFTVKGWHDEQWLAHRFGNTVRPEPYLGTVVPVHNLADITMGEFAGPRWMDVARVTISPHDPQYETKFHFTTSSMPNNMNRIALCSGTWDSCIAKEPTASPAPAQPTCKPMDPEPWWARVTNTRKEVFYFCVNRIPHLGSTMPGTVRWNWLNNDESIWTECDNGCCKVQGGT